MIRQSTKTPESERLKGMIVKNEFNYETDTEYMTCPSKIGKTSENYKVILINGYITEKAIILIGN
ncbi:hypothetical protein [Metabacillus litoralis]|uniref:hypothetical protein n=1 Tax=Metabacillus litoralis TaxID=152268 RepID=UPI00203FB469|nr:hypothetical protein [Metabacillus litoralis]MCM3163525.1 hypothetical protein [Metabacillus litoralis]